MKNKQILIGVIGGHKCDKKTQKIAYEIGKGIGQMGAILVCGGLGGVMQYPAQGAQENGGLTVGILPTDDKHDANKYIDIPIATGLGYTRNTLVITASDIIVALKGQYGTLSEIGFSLNAKKPVIGIGSWQIKGTKKAITSKQVVDTIKKIIKNGKI